MRGFLLVLMKHSSGGRSEIASICEEIKEHSYIFFVGRQANEAAHFCAKRASLERRMCLWINYTPSFLVDILSKDCNPTVWNKAPYLVKKKNLETVGRPWHKLTCPIVNYWTVLSNVIFLCNDCLSSYNLLG
jgi:hypothetical protein